MPQSTESDRTVSRGEVPKTAGSPPSAWRGFFVILLSLCGIFLLLYLDSLLGKHAELPQAGGASLSYGLLFLVGLFTGFHCVGMCGPLVVSYTVNAAKRSGSTYWAHTFYGIGKTLSYTAIGALFGGLGAIVTFTPFLRGVAGIAAGIFLLLFGLGMLNVFSGLSRFRIKTPGFLMRFIGRGVRKRSHPFVIGLLNGLMIICGPLQAMYIMAAGTGSPVEGAKLLFVFGIGTLPVMLGFGVLTSALSARVAPKLIRASGAIVIALGAIMLNRGLSMTGSGYDFNSLAARFSRETAPAPAGEEAQAGVQVIRMKVTAKGFEPDHFTLHKGVPVKWIIEGKELTYCNHRITVPSLNLEFDVHKGENVIEFVPQQAGVIPWSCWMGMIPGVFLVHETPAPPALDSPAAERREDRAAPPKEARERIPEWLERITRRLGF
jgi:sulfite exporter TauE/SafE